MENKQLQPYEQFHWHWPDGENSLGPYRNVGVLQDNPVIPNVTPGFNHLVDENLWLTNSGLYDLYFCQNLHDLLPLYTTWELIHSMFFLD